jgi:hypothetical protein
MSDDEGDLGDRFLRLNANVDYMAEELAEILRSCMRSAASGDPTSQTYRAAQTFQTLLKLIKYSDGVSTYELFEKAIISISVDSERDGVESATIQAAQMGMRYLVEKSCGDGAAGGRASKRQAEFFSAINGIEEAREESRRKFEAEYQATLPPLQKRPRTKKPKGDK